MPVDRGDLSLAQVSSLAQLSYNLTGVRKPRRRAPLTSEPRSTRTTEPRRSRGGHLFNRGLSAAVVPHSPHMAPPREPDTADTRRREANEAAHALKQLEATYADALLRVSREEGVMLEVKNNAHLESLRASNAVVNTLEEKAAVAEGAFFVTVGGVGKRGYVRRTSTHERDAKRETGADRAPHRPPNPLVDAGSGQDVNEPVGAPRPRFVDLSRAATPCTTRASFSSQKPKPDLAQAKTLTQG